MTTPRTPLIEAKVKTSAIAAAVVGLVLALLSRYVFAGGEVPDAVETMVTTVVGALVSGGITFAVGWLTRHTPRDVIQVDAED